MAGDESIMAVLPGAAPVPGAATRPRRVFAAVRRIGRDALSSNLEGKSQGELRGAQRDVILSRTVVLIWISVFVMPTTIWSFMYVSAPAYLGHAIWIVLAAIAAVLALRVVLLRGGFRERYHLAM